LTIPPLDGLDLPYLRAAMLAVDAELTDGAAGGRLAAESWANVLAVQLLRHVLAPRQPTSRRDGVPPRGRLPARCRALGGPPGARRELGAAGGGRPPQRLPLRPAVQEGHRAAAAPVRHRPPRRTSQATPARGWRPVPGGCRCPGRLLGPEPVLPSLQAHR